MKKGIRFSLCILGISTGLAIVRLGLSGILRYYGLMFPAWMDFTFFIIMDLLGFTLLGGMVYTLAKAFSIPREQKRKKVGRKVLSAAGMVSVLLVAGLFGIFALYRGVFLYGPEPKIYKFYDAHANLMMQSEGKTNTIQENPDSIDQSNTDTLEESENVQDQEMLELAYAYKASYEEMDKGSALNVVISDECVMRIIEEFSKRGYTATGECRDMVHYQQFEDFLLQAKGGREGYANYYFVRSDGGFFRMAFHSVNQLLHLETTSLAWDEAANPVIAYKNRVTIDKWDYTDKGYLIYETNDEHYQYSLQRVKPLGERLRKLCSSYIRPIGYQGNNLFLIDWDQSGMDQIVFNDLYEYLYFMDTGKKVDYDVKGVSVNEFESLFLKYFNVTAKFLRETAVYSNDKKEYFWKGLSCDTNYILHPAPEPEVVDVRQNEDETITMIVDAVDEYGGIDRLFTHEVTVRVEEEGNFQYVSNRIRPSDKKNVPRYVPRPGNELSYTRNMEDRTCIKKP